MADLGPLAVAVVLLAVVVLHQAAPASCGEANESYRANLDAQAADLYEEILDDEPESECAADGMKEVAFSMCLRGRYLAASGGVEEANKLYVAVLKMEPLDARAFDCVALAYPARADAGDPEDGDTSKCPCLRVCPNGEVDQPEPQDDEIDDPEPQDDEVDDPEPPDKEFDNPEPENGPPEHIYPKPCPWPG